ncbi:MAG: MFS transporter [Spirochaetales bacterium]|nr:MFS transporter [Spirochaetales bacterium]
MQTATHGRLAWALARYALLALFSFSLTAIGPMAPALRAEFGLSYTLAGLHQTAFALGMVTMGLAGGPLMERLGLARSMWGGMLVMLAGEAALSLAPSVAFTLGGILLASLGATLSMSAVQASLAAEPAGRRGRMILEANMTASAAAMLVPLVLLAGDRVGLGWRVVGPAAGLAFLAVAGFGLRFTPPDQGSLHRGKAREPSAETPSPACGRSGEAPSPAAASGAPRRLGPGYARMWLVLLVGVAVEWALGFWAMSYLLQKPGATPALASAAVAGLGLAAVLARFAASRLGHILAEGRMLALSFALAAAGFPLYWLAPSPFTAAAGLFVAGFGAANLYPLGFSLAVSRAPHALARASALIPVASGSAIGLAPFLLGRLSDEVGMKTALLAVPIGVALAFVLLAADRAALRKEASRA